MARDFKGGLKIAVYVRTVYVRRVVEPEGVIKLPPALSRKASVHAATFSRFRHIEPFALRANLRFHWKQRRTRTT